MNFTTVVYLKRAPEPWHAINSAQPGVAIEFVCGAVIGYTDAAAISTTVPVEHRCPYCESARQSGGAL